MRVSESHLNKFNIIEAEIQTTSKLLITSNRYDLVIKYVVVKYFESGFCKDTLPKKIRSIYFEHIKVVTEGKFTELSSVKNCPQDYLDSFFSLYRNIKTNGFDINFGGIPLARDGSIVNGAHRVAIALALKIETLPTTLIDINPLNYKEELFIRAGMQSSELDFINIKFCEQYDSAYIACLWPSVKHDLETVLTMLSSKWLSSREMEVSEIGKTNLLLHLYPDEAWIGSPENKFSGLNNKIHPCFKNGNIVRFVLFTEQSLESVLILKENIRSLYNNGKHSVHITDTSKEVDILARLTFSSEAQLICNIAQPWIYPGYFKDLKKVSQFKDITLVGSNLLGLLGKRLPSDMDFLSMDSVVLEGTGLEEKLSEHNSELRYYPQNIITNFELEDNVFYFMGIKFASIDTIIKMKRTRSEAKDISDALMLEQLVSKKNNTIELFYNKFLKVKALLRWFLLDVLRFFKIDLYVYKVYIRLKGFFK